jgi:hypothetical protein
MVHKIRKTKGIKPREPKELDDATRHGIIICHMHEDTDADIARFYSKSRRTVAAVIGRAKKRSKRDRIPLQALSNIQNSPGSAIVRGSLTKGKRNFQQSIQKQGLPIELSSTTHIRDGIEVQREYF